MYTYPVTRKEDLTETRFDIAIDDPYRWLEDDQSAETAQFVERQNASISTMERLSFTEGWQRARQAA